MKHLLLTTIAAVVLVGCGPSVDIQQAAREGNIEAVKQHIANDTDVNAKDGYGWPPLHWPACRGHKEVVELLIEKGAGVNAKAGSSGSTPLHEVDTKEIAELLIAKGADVNAKTNYGFTTLHFAKTREIAELLIAEGADVNAKGDEGDTPLDHANWGHDTEKSLASSANMVARRVIGLRPENQFSRLPKSNTSKPSNNTWMLARM